MKTRTLKLDHQRYWCRPDSGTNWPDIPFQRIYQTLETTQNLLWFYLVRDSNLYAAGRLIGLAVRALVKEDQP